MNTIRWRFLRGGNPEFTGYTVGHYDTGNPASGFVLYSRGEGGVWHQRTHPEHPPVKDQKPALVDGEWRWVE